MCATVVVECPLQNKVQFAVQTTASNPQLQRWKNIQACKQCLCNFFSSSGKICAKLYGILLEKWGMSQLRAFIVIFWQICDYLWRFMVLFGTFMALYALFGTFGLLHCFVENSLLSQFTHFFG